MHILVTNDDGVHAPGLLALAQAMKPLGKVTVLAPDRNWSVSGHIKTINRPLRIIRTELEDGTPALACDGAPSDCVALAILGLVKTPVDIVVSGVNAGPNLGYDLTYSGTVTAAMEAVINGAAGIAVSMCVPESAGKRAYQTAAKFAAYAVRSVLARKLPPGVLLNINVPCLPEEQIRGVRVTRQGLRVYRDELVTRIDPRGKPYYWIGGGPPEGILAEETDYWAVSQGYVSVTPVQLDLTAYDALKSMREWTWGEGESHA